MTIENRPFSTNLASLQNGAVEFLKISFFMPFTTQLDSVDKEKPRTESFRSVGSSLRHSGWANAYRMSWLNLGFDCKQYFCECLHVMHTGCLGRIWEVIVSSICVIFFNFFVESAVMS